MRAPLHRVQAVLSEERYFLHLQRQLEARNRTLKAEAPHLVAPDGNVYQNPVHIPVPPTLRDFVSSQTYMDLGNVTVGQYLRECVLPPCARAARDWCVP